VRLWRVSSFASIDGLGGELFTGRWHTAGRPVVYTAEHSALALLETLVRLEFDETVPPYQLLEIDAPDRLEVTRFRGKSPPGDQRDSAAWGDAWLAGASTPLALVPSALAPHAYNYLINPRHSNARVIKVVSHAHYEWDARLFE